MSKPKPKKTSAKKSKGKSAAKKKPKSTRSKKAKTSAGHNSGMNPELVADIEDVELLEENKKQLAKEIRDKKAAIKERHGVSTVVLNEELKRRKLDSDVRANYEMGLADLQKATGYQLALKLGDEAEDGGEGAAPEYDPESAAEEAEDLE